MIRVMPVKQATPFLLCLKSISAFLRQGTLSVLFLIALLFSHSELIAQLFPADGDTIYQTQLMLSVSPVLNAAEYKFVIEGNGDEKHEKGPAALINNLSFGKTYHWRVDIRLSDSSVLTEKHSFHISPQTYSDPSLYRFRSIEKNNHPESYEEGIIMLDYGSVAINRQGEVVWFLNRTAPELKDMYSRPMVLNANGNVMLTSYNGAMECDLTGKLIWISPDFRILNYDNAVNYRHRYHHEIQKLSNGDMLTLVKYYPKRVLDGVKDTITTENDAIVIYNTKNNKVAWSWKLGDHISIPEMSNVYKNNIAMGATTMPIGEINSVHLDEIRNLMYVSIRDLSTILVLEYPSGKLLRTYGTALKGAPANYLAGAFKNQHGALPDINGFICLFNNNGEFDETKMSEVLLIREPARKNDSAEIVWKFNCLLDELSSGKTPRLGYAMPLRNGNILVCMGFAGRLFEVTKDKRVVWDCLPETLPSITSANSPWTPKPNYRAHFYPTLYPNYFAVQHALNSSGYELTFFNKGFNNDSYRLYLRDKRGQRQLIMTVSVDAGKSKSITYTPPKGFSNQNLEMELVSVNSGQTRIITAK